MTRSILWGIVLLLGSGLAQPLVFLPYREGKLWGYRTPKGAVLMSPRFAEAGPFSEGLAAVRSSFPISGAGWGLINTNGAWVLLPIYENLYEVNSGAVLAQAGGRWGLLGTNGAWKIEPRLKDAWPFAEGLARVESFGRWGFIDTRGRFIVDCIFEEGWYYNDALTDSQVKVGTEGLLVPQAGGRFLRRPAGTNLLHTGYFCEGLALVKSGPGFAVVDRNNALQALVLP